MNKITDEIISFNESISNNIIADNDLKESLVESIIYERGRIAGFYYNKSEPDNEKESLNILLKIIIDLLTTTLNKATNKIR